MDGAPRLQVRVNEARGLGRSKGEVYVTVEVGRTKKKTPAVRIGSHWNTALSFEQTDEPVTVALYAKELFRDELLGSAALLLRPFPAEWTSYSLSLERRAKRKEKDKEPHAHNKDVRRSSDSQAVERTGELVLQLRISSDAHHGGAGDEDGWVVVDAHAPRNGNGNNGNGNGNGNGNALHGSENDAAPSRGVSAAAASAEASRLNSAARAAEEAERKRQEAENERLLAEFLANEYRCNVCQKSVEPSSLLAVGPACSHQACVLCLSAHTKAVVANRSQKEGIPCLVADCTGKCSDGVLMQTLPSDVFDAYISRGLEELVAGGSGAFFRCPKCHLVMERIAAPAAAAAAPAEVDAEGKPLSPEARVHKAEFRFRCRAEACATEFCAKCSRTPYHLGRTCEQFAAYVASRKCRYCQSTLPASSPASADVCAEPDCVAKKNAACDKTLQCGHACGGIKGESTCLPCLQEDCEAHKKLESSGLNQSCSDFCNICWVEDLASAPSLRLDCGHVFHHACVLKKLREKWPHARITFGFLNCPLCKQRISHPMLADELKAVLALYEELRAKALQRLEFEGMKKDADVAHPSGRYYNRPADYAMDKFAYYPCYQCKKPYFGGQRRCDAGEQNRPFDPKDLICGACAGGALATTCPRHGAEYIEYKCQFCCAIATWFCWGKTHFCEDCHTRQQKGDYVSKKPKSELPVCPGPEKCPLKRRHPPNGDEFSFGCVLCANEREF